ncbi:sulfotransferase family protein [Eubacterium oxidoreducens]|uniref:Sulfotransferase family protein n=1 Tax=Eubacterium oxidoreducens TaxID=1732 RepID=A0A1G6C492_EUBOX|nr:sulfotransferase [Eubacterium oxidoreducens]SDB27670.1 Sulfotransferase family protein [Eubacterium oxidoreducens]
MSHLTLSHNMMGCRFDNWIKLLKENNVSKEKKGQAMFITFVSAMLAIPAGLERLLFDGRIRRTKITKDPLYVIGHWRTGTTFLQNLLSKDKQFGWFDPMKTVSFNNCILLKDVLPKVEKILLKDARPMDNLDYTIDLPMEEVFAQATISTQAISHMLVFPDKGKGVKYIETAFIDEQDEKKQKEWTKAYDYILKKATYLEHGKQLMLKSPENTCRIRKLKKCYPGAKFINIYRNPYVVARSTKNMFLKEMNLLSLSEPPSEEFIEDTIVELMARIYRKAFRDLSMMNEADYIEIRYEDFVKNPMPYMRKIYEHLGLGGFDDAKDSFQKYLDDMQDYKTNQYEFSSELIRKVNEKLGFYFERYGYQMLEPNKVNQA